MGGYRLQTAKYQMEKLQKQQLDLHPSSDVCAPRPPAIPKRLPSLKAALHRNRLARCLVSSQKAESTHSLQSADGVNVEKMPRLSHLAQGLVRCSEMLGPWDW